MCWRGITPSPPWSSSQNGGGLWIYIYIHIYIYMYHIYIYKYIYIYIYNYICKTIYIYMCIYVVLLFASCGNSRRVKVLSILYKAAADSHAGCQVLRSARKHLVVNDRLTVAVDTPGRNRTQLYVVVDIPGRNLIRVVGESTRGVHVTTKFLLESCCLARTIGGGASTRDRHPPPKCGGRLVLPSLGVASHCRAGLNQLVNNAGVVGNGIPPGGAVQRQVEGVHRDVVVRPDDVMA